MDTAKKTVGLFMKNEQGIFERFPLFITCCSNDRERKESTT